MADALAPGATIGILGGGQLGRMTALAAAKLGYRAHVLAPPGDNPAFQVAAHTQAAYEDAAALDAFAQAVDVVTLEFENLPAAALDRLAAARPVRPGRSVLETAQHRIREKTFFDRIGVPTAPWVPVRGPGDLEAGLARLGRPAVLKTATQGYDGKGQFVIGPETDLAGAGPVLTAGEAILEGFVPFEREISVIVARGPDGSLASYEPAENRHREHILHTTTLPAAIGAETAREADRIARAAAAALDLEGVLAVEMFVSADGGVLVNEMAPRPHNSGHWTLDGAATSQFEQLVRAVCALPLGDPSRLADVEMTNLLGAQAGDWRALMAEPGARVHLYGKADARPGRKMGHVTRLSWPGS